MRCLLLVLLAGILMTHPAETSAEERNDRIAVRELSPQWRIAGPAVSWSTGGEIVAPVQSVPGGDLLAVVRRAASIDVVRWDRRGKELVRRTLDLDAPPVTARPFGKEFVLATRKVVLALDAGTLQTARSRPLPQSSDTDRLEAAPSGVWVLGRNSASFLGFDGQTATRPWPLSKLEKPPCPAEGPCVQARQKHDGWVLDSGDLLVVETLFEEYPVKGNGHERDTVEIAIATRLDVKAQPVARLPMSQIETKWEWFWRGGTSGNPTGIPTPGGIVRTRYRTAYRTGLPLAPYGSDFIFESTPSKNRLELALLDAHLAVRWKTRITELDVPVVSPRWVVPTLVHSDDCYMFASLDERGKLLGQETILMEDLQRDRFADKNHPLRFAIGQTSPGAGWLLIAY
jgi:hypothetical protein